MILGQRGQLFFRVRNRRRPKVKSLKSNITKPHIATPAGHLAARAVAEGRVYSHNYSAIEQDYQLPSIRRGDYAMDCFIPGISHAGAWEPVDLREEFEAKTTTKALHFIWTKSADHISDGI